MNQSFSTTAMSVIIEGATYSGSAFGANDKGEAVFFNSRIVERMELEEGQLVYAHCIPNYEDKRDQIPWRCIRVEQGSDTPDPVVETPVLTPAEVDAQVLRLLSGTDCYWTTKELADDFDSEIETKTIGNSCMRLFNKGKIAKAEVFAASSQDRPSFNLWAASIDAFK